MDDDNDFVIEYANKTRFSKLQKWILTELYKSISDEYPRGLLSRRNIVWDYFGLNRPGKGYIPPSTKVEVTTTRSIWNLYEAGYISAYSKGKDGYHYHPALERDVREEMERIGPRLFGRNIKLISLNEKGIEKAKELLNVKSEKLTIRPATVKI